MSRRFRNPEFDMATPVGSIIGRDPPASHKIMFFTNVAPVNRLSNGLRFITPQRIKFILCLDRTITYNWDFILDHWTERSGSHFSMFMLGGILLSCLRFHLPARYSITAAM